jgi:hypothetical protein
VGDCGLRTVCLFPFPLPLVQFSKEKNFVRETRRAGSNYFKASSTPSTSPAPCLLPPEIALDMVLPLSHSEKTYRLCEDLIIPTQSTISIFPRPFTKLGNFPSTIQATYLSSLVTTHINHEYPSHEDRREAAGRLDAALESFGSTLIPPPGCAEGVYCGAYWMRTT